MESPELRNVHPELHPLLLPFHKVNGKTLRSVWRLWEDGSLTKIILGFENELLVIQVDPYDDTIVTEVVDENNYDVYDCLDATRCKPWSTFIGETFGWGWIAINQQDALDGILLSFSGILPQLFLNVVASSLKESTIVAVS